MVERWFLGSAIHPHIGLLRGCSGSVFFWMSVVEGNSKGAEGAAWLTFLMPMMVYVFYIFYGGMSYSRRVNRFMQIHAAMKYKEVIGLFKDHFDPLREWPIDKLSELSSPGKYVRKVDGLSGQRYLLTVMSGSLSSDENSKRIVVHAVIARADHKNKREFAWAQFKKAEDGCIEDDAFAPKRRWFFLR